MVDLPDVRDEVGLDPSRLLGELEQTVEELVVRKRLKCVCVLHGSCIPRTFSRAWGRFGAMKNERDGFEGSLHHSRPQDRLQRSSARVVDGVRELPRSRVRKLSREK